MRFSIAIVSGIVSVLTVLATSAFASVEELPVGEAPPDFTLERTDGGEVSLSADFEGPTVLVFGEMYQRHSLRAMAELEDIVAKIDQPIRVLMIVSEDRTVEELETARQEAGITSPVLMDRGRTVFVDYGVISAIPCMVFIDSGGAVHHAVAGYGVTFVDTAENELAFLTGQITAEELQSRLRGPAPEDSEADRLQRHVRLGDQLRGRGFLLQAEAEYETVLATDPGHIGAHLGLAQLDLGRSELDAAESHVRAALEQSADLPRGLKTLARIQLRRGDLDEVEQTLQRLIHMTGEDARTLYLLGRLSEARGEESAAMRHYRQVSEALLSEEGW